MSKLLSNVSPKRSQDGLHVRWNMNKGPWASVWANSAGHADEGGVVEDMVNAPLLPSRGSISGEMKKVQVKQDRVKKDCPWACIFKRMNFCVHVAK